jgi:hypothetical protein
MFITTTSDSEDANPQTFSDPKAVSLARAKTPGVAVEASSSAWSGGDEKDVTEKSLSNIELANSLPPHPGAVIIETTDTFPLICSRLLVTNFPDELIKAGAEPEERRGKRDKRRGKRDPILLQVERMARETLFTTVSSVAANSKISLIFQDLF